MAFDKSKNILVFGATGQQGGAVANELLKKGYKVQAFTRKPESENATALKEKGAEIVQGDLDEPDSLKRALRGASGVFAIQNTWEAGVEKEEEQGIRVAKLAKEAGVEHFVYTSVGSAHRNTGIPHFDNKWRVENVIREQGFPSYTIIRPVFFMENLISPWFKPAIDDGTLAAGIKQETPLQMIAVQDIGKYGLFAFEKADELNGKSIDIAGDELTMPQTAALISQAAGRKINHYQVPIEEVRKMSEDNALMLEWFDAVGYDVNIDGNASKYGIRPTPFKEWAQKQNW